MEIKFVKSETQSQNSNIIIFICLSEVKSDLCSFFKFLYRHVVKN